MQFRADGVGENKILAADGFAFRRQILGGGEQCRQHDCAGMHPRRIMLIVEIERVRGGAVGHRSGRRRVAALADEAGGGAGFFPAREARVEFGNAGRSGRAADHAQRIEDQCLGGLHHFCGQCVIGPTGDGGAQRAAVAIGQGQGFGGEHFFDVADRGGGHNMNLRRVCNQTLPQTCA